MTQQKGDGETHPLLSPDDVFADFETLDADGELHERVYDAAVSEGRSIDDQGRASEPVGNTVDVADASYTNTIGAARLMAYWEDPDFDPTESAFYYVRVLEIPTPRWTAYDAKFFGLTLPPDTVMQLQERAYTSPIWYTPQAHPGQLGHGVLYSRETGLLLTPMQSLRTQPVRYSSDLFLEAIDCRHARASAGRAPPRTRPSGGVNPARNRCRHPSRHD